MGAPVSEAIAMKNTQQLWQPWSSGYGRRKLTFKAPWVRTQHRILDGHFFTYNVAKIVTFVEKNPEMIKEAEVVPFKKHSITTSNHICGIVQETCSTKLFSL